MTLWDPGCEVILRDVVTGAERRILARAEDVMDDWQWDYGNMECDCCRAEWFYNRAVDDVPCNAGANRFQVVSRKVHGQERGTPL